jgi:hypothetical protein
MYALQVRHPPPSRKIMRVADAVANNWLLSTNIATLCHLDSQIDKLDYFSFVMKYKKKNRQRQEYFVLKFWFNLLNFKRQNSNE